MTQKEDDVFILLIRTQRNTEGTWRRVWSGAGVGLSEVGTGHHLTTAVAHEPQSPVVCFPTTNQNFPILYNPPKYRVLYAQGTFLIIFPSYHVPIIPREQMPGVYSFM